MLEIHPLPGVMMSLSGHDGSHVIVPGMLIAPPPPIHQGTMAAVNGRSPTATGQLVALCTITHCDCKTSRFDCTVVKQDFLIETM